MRQYFIDDALESGMTIILKDEISHHLKDVLRSRDGDIIRLVDNSSRVFLASLSVSNQVTATIGEQCASEDQQGKITCLACLIKKDKWELLLQKAAELGADVIVPVISSRTIIHFEQKEIAKKMERWNKITLEACQQSNRSSICRVERPVKLSEVKNYLSDNNLVAYENEEGHHLINYVSDQSISILTGPEGGLSKEEVKYLNDLGFISCSLGSRILRAETAMMYALSIIDGRRSML